MAHSEGVSEIKDGDLIEALERTYRSTLVPPCQVCGGELSIQSIGGGEPTVWACDPREWLEEGRFLYKAGRGFLDDHYERSRWVDVRQGGDPRVMELIRRYQALDARERGMDHLDNSGVYDGVLITELCALALKADFALPPLSPGIVMHPKLGELHDRIQMQQYGLRVAEEMLMAAIKGALDVPEAPGVAATAPAR